MNFFAGPGDSHNSNHNPTQFSPHVDSNLEAILSGKLSLMNCCVRFLCSLFGKDIFVVGVVKDY